MKTIIGLVALAVVAVLIYAGYVWTRVDEVPMAAQNITTEGEYICLPHVDTDGPQTLECALGLATDDGNYALDTSELDPSAVIDLATGDRIEVTGTVMARDELTSGDRLLAYDIEGVIRVSEIRNVEDTADRHVMAGGEVAFNVPEDFGLAVTAEQVLVDSVVPPCRESFDYCLYYNDSRFENTNFESAGVRIEARDDLADEEMCLATQPAGYSDLTPGRDETDTYATSIFTPLQDSAAGHTAEGSLYRLWHSDSCYEFETRLGTTQFGNYEAGAITEFTQDDRRLVEGRLMDVLGGVRIVGNEDEQVF